MYTFPKDRELTSEDLQEFLNRHKQNLSRYDKLKRMYLGQHDILYNEKKADFKPDNRLVVNFAKYIVDTLNGYFIGNPIKTTHPNDEVSERMRDIAKRNNQNDNNAELSKLCSIYGHAYEYMYQDEDGNTRVTYIEPQQAFVIYDDTIAQEPLYGVYVYENEDKKLEGLLYSKHDRRTIRTGEGSLININDDAQEHYFGDVPINEYLENEERQSVFEGVESLINAYNKALSEKANDVDYFADAYLAILGVALNDEDIKRIRDNRIINLKDGDVNKIIVQFLDKPNADATQENLIERLETLIFQISMVANINDETFGASSGVSLKYKLQSMENLTLMKERKFNAGMVRRFKMMFNIPTNFPVDKDGYLDIEYMFTRNIPNNIVEEADTASKLAGITSKETQLAALSIVDNVSAELERIEKEESERSSFLREVNTPLVEVNEDE